MGVTFAELDIAYQMAEVGDAIAVGKGAARGTKLYKCRGNTAYWAEHQTALYLVGWPWKKGQDYTNNWVAEILYPALLDPELLWE